MSFSSLMHGIVFFKLHIWNIYVCYNHNIFTETDLDNYIPLYLYRLYVLLRKFLNEFVRPSENVYMKISV